MSASSGGPDADVGEELAEPPHLVRDLSVAPAHGRGGLSRAKDPAESRVELLFLGLLMRADLLHEQAVGPPDPGQRLARGGEAQ